MKTILGTAILAVLLTLGACSDDLGPDAGNVELRTDRSSYLPGDLIEVTILNQADRGVEHTHCLDLQRWIPERQEWQGIVRMILCPRDELFRLEAGHSSRLFFRIPERFQPDPRYRLRLDGVLDVPGGALLSKEFEIGYPPP